MLRHEPAGRHWTAHVSQAGGTLLHLSNQHAHTCLQIPEKVSPKTQDMMRATVASITGKPPWPHVSALPSRLGAPPQIPVPPSPCGALPAECRWSFLVSFCLFSTTTQSHVLGAYASLALTQRSTNMLSSPSKGRVFCCQLHALCDMALPLPSRCHPPLQTRSSTTMWSTSTAPWAGHLEPQLQLER